MLVLAMLISMNVSIQVSAKDRKSEKKQECMSQWKCPKCHGRIWMQLIKEQEGTEFEWEEVLLEIGNLPMTIKIMSMKRSLMLWITTTSELSSS